MATSPIVVPDLPRLRLYNVLECRVGDWLLWCALAVPYFANSSALSFTGKSQCPGIHWMDVFTPFWLCSLLAVVSTSVTIGCSWCCICATARIADSASVNTTMLFMHGLLGLPVIGDGLSVLSLVLHHSLLLVQCCPHAALMAFHVASGWTIFCLLLPARGCSTGKSGVAKCNRKKDGKYQHCSSCKKYVRCRGGKLSEKKCPLDKVWDDKAKECTWWSTTCSWA